MGCLVVRLLGVLGREVLGDHLGPHHLFADSALQHGQGAGGVKFIWAGQGRAEGRPMS